MVHLYMFQGQLVTQFCGSAEELTIQGSGVHGFEVNQAGTHVFAIKVFFLSSLLAGAPRREVLGQILKELS